MTWEDGASVFVEAAGYRLEGQCFGPSPAERPTLVMLHEGLGSAGLWRTFPQQIAERSNWGVFAYSRAGYGRSSPKPLPWPISYMADEARIVLPDVIDAIGLRRGALLGHSDGASIAAIHAGSLQDHRVRGLILMAPHFFTEPQGLRAVAAARTAFASGGLRERMSRHHDDPDNAFRGWNDSWMNPAFAGWNIEEVIAYIRVPVLAIQGAQDEYGTLAQLAALRTGLYSPYDQLVLDNCGHSPHRDCPDAVLEAVVDHLSRIERIDLAGSAVGSDGAAAS